MDSLLEKLRAAAPQARDQRDRRRRARLKERHQVRVASGQKIPDLAEINAPGNGDDDSNRGDASASNLLSPNGQDDDASNAGVESQVSESEDIAERAASMLQGLRNSADADSERHRRRRETAEEERRNRRMRRRNGATSGSKDSADGSLPSVREQDSPAPTDQDVAERTSNTPAIVVSTTGDEEGLPPEGDEPADGSSPSTAIELSE